MKAYNEGIDKGSTITNNNSVQQINNNYKNLINEKFFVN
jgi:hypothetical protein